MENLTASGQATTPISLAGSFSVSLRGGWVGTVLIERSFDQGATWGTVASYTANIEDVGDDPEGALYRAKCSAYTSGSIAVRLGQ
jgi:hypothetical protein